MSHQDIDPRPVPPARPSREDCCRSSCDPCIFDVYDEALDRYRSALRAWEERQAQVKKDIR
jgi:hypothetical protein